MPNNRLSAENANFLMNYSEIEFNLKATRRSFVLLLFFDFTFTSLLWLIYITTKGLSLEEAYTQEIKNYNIDSSLFDVAVASVVRFILLNLFYTILKLNHWIPAAVITFASSSFLISKVVIFAIKGTHKIITDYLILIISFLIVWVQTWYLDVKIFSTIKKQAVFLDTENSTNSISNNPRQNYGSINTPRGILSEVASFYASPLESPRELSDDENETRPKIAPKLLRKKPSREVISTLDQIYEDKTECKYQPYVVMADDLVKRVMGIYDDNSDWKTLAEFDLADSLKETNIKFGLETKCLIRTKQFPKIGKVFKLETIVPFNEGLILKVLRDNVEECTKWNITVESSKTVVKISNDLSIVHVCVFEQAGGMVSPRDFVNLSKYSYVNQQHVVAAVACKIDIVPESKSYVRGENGPTSYIFSKIDENTTQMTYILNVNLKGWLPQYLIDQSLSTVQKDFILTLIKYLNEINY